jgi:sugar phosphate isomerase/epimerase
MSLAEVIEFCADLNFDAVDPTGYYFGTYPDVPEDDYIFYIKRRAFLLGLDISGTGVRNDFATADRGERTAGIERVKRWVVFASKLGAPVLRVFAGRRLPENQPRERATERLVGALEECADYAGRHGVMIVLQNHAEFLTTADQVIEVLEAVDSDWLGLNLDIGSFPSSDPYREIAKAAPYAVTWQIKEHITRADGSQEKTDLSAIVRIVRETGYRGYLPIETLGEGDPRKKVPRLLAEVREALG